MTTTPHTSDRCGIILAGGEGERLRPFVLRLRGDTLPKQYVRFVGTRSMLEHTWDRCQQLIPPERLLTVVSQGHLIYPEVGQQLSGRPPGTVIVLPSDHFIVEEECFMAHVAMAFRTVERKICLEKLSFLPAWP